MTVFGDAEAAVVAILRATPALVGVTVSTDLVGFTGAQRWIRVTRTGGVPTLWMRLDNPVIAIAAYAAEKGTALDDAGAACAAVHGARGLYAGHGLALYDVLDVEGLAWSPDDQNPNLDRYLFTLALVTKPA